MTDALTLDALAPGHPGRWSDGDVTVCHGERAAVPVRMLAGRDPDGVTEHFEVHRAGETLVVLHRMRPDELDDDLAGLLAVELGGTGLLRGHDDFCRVFTGVVRSTISDPVTAWSVFYANTLAALAAPERAHPGGSIAAMAPVHRRTLDLVAGSTVLDVGCCFGFLSLRMVDRGFRVLAGDLCPGTVALLGTVAERLGRRLQPLACDAARLPLADRSVDTVTAVHLLEHLTPGHGAAALAEILRVARRRAVVAVPFEEQPDATYGHQRTFDPAALDTLGAGTGLPYRVDTHHGGWLVIDQP